MARRPVVGVALRRRSSRPSRAVALSALLLLARGGTAHLDCAACRPTGPTWDCGYADAARRMQYGSGSFGADHGVLPGFLAPSPRRAPARRRLSRVRPFGRAPPIPSGASCTNRSSSVGQTPRAPSPAPASGRLTLYLVYIFVTMVVTLVWSVVRPYADEMPRRLLPALSSLAACSGFAGLLFRRDPCAGQHVRPSCTSPAAPWVRRERLRPLRTGLVRRGLRVALPSGVVRLAIDRLSAFFLMPVLLVSALGSIYGEGYWSAAAHPGNARRLRCFYGIATAGLLLVMVAGDAWSFSRRVGSGRPRGLLSRHDRAGRCPGAAGGMDLPHCRAYRDPRAVRDVRTAPRGDGNVAPGAFGRRSAARRC